MTLDQAVEAVGSVDVAGILIIIVGAVASVRYVVGARGGRASDSLYLGNLGRTILLALDNSSPAQET